MKRHHAGGTQDPRAERAVPQDRGTPQPGAPTASRSSPVPEPAHARGDPPTCCHRRRHHQLAGWGTACPTARAAPSRPRGAGTGGPGGPGPAGGEQGAAQPGEGAWRCPVPAGADLSRSPGAGKRGRGPTPGAGHPSWSGSDLSARRGRGADWGRWCRKKAASGSKSPGSEACFPHSCVCCGLGLGSGDTGDANQGSAWALGEQTEMGGV